MKFIVLLTLITSLTHIVGFAIYNRHAWKSMVEPNIASWGLWAGITVLNFTSYGSMSGDWLKSLLPTVSSALCILTFIVAMLKGGKFSKLDGFEKKALLAGVLAVVAWRYFHSATYANLIVQIAVMIGFIPTLRGVLAHPEKERPLPWFIWTTAYVLGTTVVVLRWSGHPADLVYPGLCVLAHLSVGLIAMRGKQIGK